MVFIAWCSGLAQAALRWVSLAVAAVRAQRFDRRLAVEFGLFLIGAAVPLMFSYFKKQENEQVEKEAEKQAEKQVSKMPDWYGVRVVPVVVLGSILSWTRANAAVEHGEGQ